MRKIVRLFSVTEDRETGEWLTDPTYIGETLLSVHNAKADTANIHFDTFERPYNDGLETETCAVEVSLASTP